MNTYKVVTTLSIPQVTTTTIRYLHLVEAIADVSNNQIINQTVVRYRAINLIQYPQVLTTSVIITE